MTPRAIAIWILAVASAGAALYAVKDEVRALETQIAQTQAETAALRGAQDVLRAEWAYLTKPERIAALSRTHLGLRPLDAGKALSADALPLRPEDAPPPPPLAVPQAAAPLAPIPEGHALRSDDMDAAPWR